MMIMTIHWFIDDDCVDDDVNDDHVSAFAPFAEATGTFLQVRLIGPPMTCNAKSRFDVFEP